MNLRKQLFSTFLFVAIVPLLIGGLYILGTNIKLAFSLYEQNLRDSTEIQADLVEENLYRLMVRSGRFASSVAVRNTCQKNLPDSLDTMVNISNDVMNFTDETLDSVSMFVLTNKNGQILYSSGSNDDTQALSEEFWKINQSDEQYVMELEYGEHSTYAIYTPVKNGNLTVGGFLVICRTDYLLRLISAHRQVKASNAFIYCGNHNRTVISKRDSAENIPALDKKLRISDSGTLIAKVNDQGALIYYYKLSKLPWILVSTIPVAQILSQVHGYVMANILVLFLVFLAIMFLSKRLSHKILQPLKQLLDGVEQFFLSGAKQFPALNLNPATEIGYLAEKFTNMSDEMAVAQEKLRESTYLYHTLLQASYEFRIVIDLKNNELHCSYAPVTQRLQGMPDLTASEKVLLFLAGYNDSNEENIKKLNNIVYGNIDDAALIEVRCNMGKYREECWYRIIGVPIKGEDGHMSRVVLHFEDITEQKREEFRLIRSSQMDPLCGLFNKTAFPLHCRMSETGKYDAVFFIDLDCFKQVNDTLGHNAGDEVLISTAQAIRAQFREKDIIGRFGGDEFVAFIPEVTKDLVEKKAAALINAIHFKLPLLQDEFLEVTASIGICIASYPMPLEQAIHLADEAMYEAKENGKARYYIIDPSHKFR